MKPGGHGYDPGLRSAGRYSRERALEICRNALPTAGHIGRISEIPVRLSDMTEMLKGGFVPACVMGELPNR